MILNKRLLRTGSYIFIALILIVLINVKTSNKDILPSLLSLNSDIQVTEPDILIGVGFETCTAFSFFEKCDNNIKKFYKEFNKLIEDPELIKSIKINKLKKDLNGDTSTFTTIYPYEIKISKDLIKKYKIPVIEEFYIHNKLDDTLIKNTLIPNKILIETKNTTNINELNNLGYYNPGYGLWYKISNSNLKSFTNINFLFNGHFDNIIPGLSLVSDKPLNIHKNDDKSIGSSNRDYSNRDKFDYHKFDSEVYVYVKENKLIELPKINLKSHKDGTFKITQLADLHLSTGFGKCRDIYPSINYPEKNCLADELTLDFIDLILDIEKPDLVILSGDQLYSIECFDSETAILKILTILINRKIPYALVFGNHDTEIGSLNRLEMMNLISKLPYSLSIPGPEEVTGIGNYQLIINDYKNNKPAIEIFMLDSHSEYPKNLKKIGYEYFTEDQKEYVERLDSYIKEENPNTELIKMAFFHIPLFEYRNINNLNENEFDGNFIEPVISSNTNSGMFEIFKKINVKMVSVGHDHCNDFCFQNDGITLCYAGGAGFGGYGGYGGYIRRIRSFEINVNTKQITSWKRLYDDPENVVDKSTY